MQNRVARGRELKANDQSYDLTTEDDTMSEIKLGRYWNKDERKKHMEKAKERRHRQEQVLEKVKLVQRKNILNADDGGSALASSVAAGVTAATGNGAAKTLVSKTEVVGVVGECKDNKIMGLLSVTTV